MIRCLACGYANDGGREFCQSCGQFLEWTGERGEDVREKDDGVFFSTDHTVGSDGFVAPVHGADLEPPPPPPSPPMPGAAGDGDPEQGDDVPALPSPPDGRSPWGFGDGPPPPPSALPEGGLPPPSSLGEDPEHWRPPAGRVRPQMPDVEALARIVKRPPTDRSQRRAAASLLAPHRTRRPGGVEISLSPTNEDRDEVAGEETDEPTLPLGPVLPGVQRSFVDTETVRRQPPSRAPKPGDIHCVHCGEVNLPNRAFCRRCGEDMPAGVAAMEAPASTWLERLLDGWFARRRSRPERRYRAGERPVEATPARGERRSRVLWRSIKKAGRVSFGYLIALLAILALVGAVLPQAQPVRQEIVERLESVGQRINNFLIPQFVLVNPSAVAASSEQEANPAEQIADGFSNRYWAENAAGDGTGSVIQFTFEERVELERMAVLNGGVPPREEFVSQPRPRLLRLTYDDGSTEMIELRDERELQEHRLDGPPTSTITIEILSVYAARLGGSDAAITEIEFLRRL